MLTGTLSIMLVYSLDIYVLFTIMMIARENKNCRICSSTSREVILDFGNLALTGVFLELGSDVPRAPLSLIRCLECGLIQLAHSYDSSSLYGETYGYESHLNKGMVGHLTHRAKVLESRFLQSIPSPIVVDIASNDGTMLTGYRNPAARLVGIDPLISVVSDCYPGGATKIAEFFSADVYQSQISSKANLVTSLSVLYDLDSPETFASGVHEILEDEGVWHFEQSYLPTMIRTLSYDTICHEHLLYLSLHDIERILKKTGFQLLDATLNSANGGSIAVTAIKSKSVRKASPFVDYLLVKEVKEGIVDGTAIKHFAKLASAHKLELTQLIKNFQANGYLINGLGASTKGNVLLQWLGFDSLIIQSIGDINPRKYGKQTPGTGIPIVPEEQVMLAGNAKTLTLVLPWHFRVGIIEKSTRLLESGGSLLFPLPQVEVVA